MANQESVGAAPLGQVSLGSGRSQHPPVLNDKAHSINGRSSTHQKPPLLANPIAVAQEFEMGVAQHYLPLYRAAISGDFERARSLVGHYTNSWAERITCHGKTVIMIAAGARQWQFVQKLVEILPPEALAMADVFGFTILHAVAISRSLKTAKALINKNSALTQITDERGYTPLFLSTHLPRNKEMVWYLTLVTRDEYPSPTCPFTGTMSGQLIYFLTAGGYNDVTLHLIGRYPHLALADFGNGWHLLRYLSENPSQFLSGSKLTPWERWIEKFIPAQTEYANIEGIREMETPKQPSRCLRVQVPGVKQIQEIKLQHICAVELVKYVCEQLVSNMNPKQAHNYLREVMYSATSLGIVEIASICLQYFPDFIRFEMLDLERNMLHVAVRNRQHKIFNLISELPTFIPVLASFSDESENTIWHLTAKLAPPPQLLSVSGAALQMQLEVLWFKEVEKLVRPAVKNWTNKFGHTAEEVFREEHRELAEKGEKWMKDTANSCMIASTLIATVVFAAAFTVPESNKSDEGYPINWDWHENWFRVFAISDALALFSSSTSLLMFLAILTARYEPEDFLLALPRRFIIGLGSLFLSIITMMVASGAATVIALGEGWQWVSIPISLLAFIPVTSFVNLQLPLFIQLVQSTYGSSIFVKSYW